LTQATPEGRIPEIPYEKSGIAVLVEQLPKVVEKFAALEDQAHKAVADVRGVTREIKDNPSVLLWGPKDKNATGAPVPHERTQPEASGPRAAVARKAK
jgi:hypothetical protein